MESPSISSYYVYVLNIVATPKSRLPRDYGYGSVVVRWTARDGSVGHFPKSAVLGNRHLARRSASHIEPSVASVAAKPLQRHAKLRLEGSRKVKWVFVPWESAVVLCWTRG